MPIYKENAGEQGLPKNIFIRFLIFLSLIGMSAVVMKPVQTAIQMGMAHVRGNFIEKIENITGMEVRYSSIRPTIFGSFDIRDLELLKNEEAVISVSRTRISFSILELLRGKTTAFHTIQIEKPVLLLDMERDAEIIQLISSARKETENKKQNKEREIIDKLAELFPEKTDFKIRDCYLSIKDGAFSYSVENLNMNISGNRDQLLFNGKFTAAFHNTGFFSKAYGLKTDVGINGVYSPNFEGGEARVVFSSLSLSVQNYEKSGGTLFNPVTFVPDENLKEFINLKPLAFDLVFQDNLLSLTSGERERFYGYFVYNLVNARISAALDCHNFTFADVIAFSDSKNSFNHLLSLPVEGKAFFTREKNSGLMSYDVNLRGGESGKTADSFAIVVNGSEKNVDFKEFWISASPSTAKAGLFQGRFSIKGKMGIDTLTPFGTIAFSKFSLTGNEFVDVVFNVSSNRKEIAITSEKASFGKCVLDDVEIFLFPSEKDLGFLISAQRNDEGRIFFDSTLNYKPRQFDASLALGSFSAIDLVEIMRPFSDNVMPQPITSLYLYDTFLHADLFFTTDFKQFVYNAPNVMIKSGDTEGMLSFSGTDRQFSLSEGVFYIDKKEFLVSAQVNYSTVQDLIFTVRASYLDFSWNVEGQILDKTTLIIRDPNGLNAYGSVANNGAFSGYIEGISFPFPVNGKPVYFNFYITARYASKDFWSVDVTRFEAVNISSPDGSNFFKLSGAADQNGASFREIILSDHTGMLAGSADCVWDSDYSFVHFIANMTDGKEAGELLSVDAVYKEKQFNFSASFSDIRVDRFLKDSSPILLSAEASAKWKSMESFSVDINLNSLYAKLSDKTINASAAINASNDEFSINNLNLNFADVIAYLPTLQIDRQEGFAKATADIQGFVMEKWLDGKIMLDANFAQIETWAQLREALDSINGRLIVDDLWYAGIEYKTFDFLFANNKGDMSLSGGPDNMLRMEIDNEGDFFAALSAPFPIHATIAGKYKNKNIDAYCNDFFLDLNALWALITPMPNFRFNGGYATAQISIRGPILNPEFFGSGRGSSLRMVVPNYISEEIKPIPFDIEFNGSEMSFGPVPAMVGKGSLTITCLFIFERWVPDNFTLEIKVPRESPIPYSINISGFLASGDASGNITLNLDNRIMDVNANLLANNAEMGMNFDELSQARSEYRSGSNSKFSTTVSMVVTTGSVAEFIWPNSSSPILRANPEMGTVINITADTLAGQYSLNTDVKLRSGEINYFDRSFYIRQGNLVFRENERQFSPRITARAEIRDRTDTGPVTISMVIDNEPLLSFVPRFEASPVLTQFEIYSLLGQNIYTAGGTNENIDAAQLFFTSTADLLGQFIGLRTFEKQVRNVLSLDMFSVRTRILQNAVTSGVRAAGMGDTQVDRNNRVGNYFDNTTVFAGKYVGQDMFVQGMLSLGYDENNQNYGGLKPELDIGIELQSPLFNIRWDFFPYHPENWWVTDQSITLTWSKSF